MANSLDRRSSRQAGLAAVSLLMIGWVLFSCWNWTPEASPAVQNTQQVRSHVSRASAMLEDFHSSDIQRGLIR